MNIVVCTKAVPDGPSTVALDARTSTVQCKPQRLRMNDGDEYALEEALALKRQLAARVDVFCVGGTRHQDILYQALAKGADSATRIDAEFNDDPQLTASILAAAIKDRTYDLIVTGVESADTMAAQVGASVAAVLGVPCVSAVTSVQIRAGERRVRVVKELGGGTSATVEADLPALVCVQSGIRRLSYAGAVKVMRARRQSLGCLSLHDLRLSADELNGRRLKIVRVFEPPKADYATIIEGGTVAGVADALLEKIKDVCGVLK